MTELQSGVVLGRYELLVRIGRGGMASVWVARERSAVSGKERLVAVKAMLPELATHSEFRSMFLGEVQIIQSINHENVVRVFEVSEDHGTLYMAMEWVEGDSLRNLIRAAKSRGALPPEIAVRIAADAAAGLHAAHELRDWDGELRGVVHCDVSPHNILVGIDGRAKLVDFGIANALGRLESQGDGEKIKGKLSYMSPEQANGQRVDRRTDIFALGIVLFELTTGEQLFKGRDGRQTLELVRHGIVPRPSQLNPRYPERLEAVVMRALDRDPDRRFQTAAELETMLMDFLYQERILVSHSAVAQLLLRVTGPRIEKRREVITRVIQAVDGQVDVETLGTHQLDALSDLVPTHSDPFNYTFTSAGDESSSLGIAARLESHTVVAPRPSSQMPEEPVLIEPDSPRPSRRILASAAGLLLVIVAVIVYLLVRPSDSSANLVAMQRQATPAISASTATGATDPIDLDLQRDPEQGVENLPVAREANRGIGPTAVRRGSKGKSSSKDEVYLWNTPEPNKDSDDDGKTAATQQGGINRVTANAALASAAATTRSCRGQGDSPTGQGRAAVTFAPDGSVAAVTLPQRFVGTAVGNCVAARFRQAHAPPFKGEPVTLFYTFDVPE
jgi:eukaryotic-like serine/threonine-protein kinase